ncbi:PIN domain-like protein [Coniophora puteana RWD-64-598 SS2]|uniref:PIN domain-like protein n=1 Tax=Coniophora puteana (strain RWD-64-598) TaxID=741705 RepID=A0A5M3MHN1_CONPW|nr:PIN domain-like protein [Coniophora puteana RWD-64-598 SS2]EIW78450.1 PIN domain-like protein [Coniophora puteana RWD-64-598 SS2]
MDTTQSPTASSPSRLLHLISHLPNAMGIKGLWPLLAPSCTEHQLSDFAISRALQGPLTPTSLDFTIGVDASILMYTTFKGQKRAQINVGENDVLKTLFFRLLQLAATPARYLFVFDGSARPAIKRNKHVRTSSPFPVKGLKAFIRAMGFDCHDAPGEAEAELAALNGLGVIDAVMTTDSDAFLFGAKCVLRMYVINHDPYTIQLYTQERLTNTVDLSRGGLVLMALLVGGDYHPGLPGCGTATAYALAQYGFGDDLVDAMLHADQPNLSAFLATLRGQISHAANVDPKGLFRSKRPSISASLTREFPNVNVLNAYMHPATSVTRGDPLPILSPLMKIDIPRLAELCQRHLCWTSQEVMCKFRPKVWHVAFLRRAFYVSNFDEHYST